MRIGEIARLTGLSNDALRLYEKMGLIQSRRQPNGYREYPEQTVRLLGLVRTGQRLGLSLSRIASLMADLGQLPEPERDAAIRQMITAQLQTVESRIDELVALRDELRTRLNEPCPLARGRDIDVAQCVPPATAASAAADVPQAA
ncbi:MerR family DNA-binding transcriptional regulator [Rhizobacter sp. LjRoot28]|uniref:MerR family DNA-binding transcriptional regulator n=1 Tax=Rhizobacter sp. LjRoot28 TaxID=3342309 RepID=UPI003ECFA26E